MKVRLCAKKMLSLKRILTPLHPSDSSNYNHSSFLSRKWLLITDTQTLWSRPCNDIGVCCPWTGLSFPLPSNLRSSQWSSFKQKGCWKFKNAFPGNYCSLLTSKLWPRPCNECGVCCPLTGLSFPLPSNLRSSQWSSFKQKGCWKFKSDFSRKWLLLTDKQTMTKAF